MDTSWRVPGPVVDISSPNWRPTGLADGVVFLSPRGFYQQVPSADGSRLAFTMIEPGTEEQALRYLRPCSAEWYLMHPRMHGVSRVIDLSLDAAQPCGLWDAPRKAKRQLVHHIVADHPRVEQINDPQVLGGLRAEQVEEGIWLLAF
jgi:hypothetical protein